MPKEPSLVPGLHGGRVARLPRGLGGALLAWSPVTVVAMAVACAVPLAVFPAKIIGIRPAPFEGEVRLRCSQPACGGTTVWFAFESPDPPSRCPVCNGDTLLVPMTCRNCGLRSYASASRSVSCPDCGSTDMHITSLGGPLRSAPAPRPGGENPSP